MDRSEKYLVGIACNDVQRSRFEMSQKLAIGAVAAILIFFGEWCLYWYGYARAIEATSHLGYDQEFTSSLQFFGLRQKLLTSDLKSIRCEMDSYASLRLEELEQEESALKGPPSITWRDLIYGMRELDSFMRSKHQRTVRELKEKFALSSDSLPVCN